MLGNGVDSPAGATGEGKRAGGDTAKRSRSAKDKTGGKREAKTSPDPPGSKGPRQRTLSCPEDSRQGGQSNGGKRAGEGAGVGERPSGGRRLGEDGNQLEVKIYRSYSNLTDARHASFMPDPLDTSNIKVLITWMYT